jgi:hypothetical protein
MHPEEKIRLHAKWAVWHCPWDNVKKTNMPTQIVSPNFDTRDEAEKYLEKHYPNRKEYSVLKTDGNTGFY